MFYVQTYILIILNVLLLSPHTLVLVSGRLTPGHTDVSSGCRPIVLCGTSLTFFRVVDGHTTETVNIPYPEGHVMRKDRERRTGVGETVTRRYRGPGGLDSRTETPTTRGAFTRTVTRTESSRRHPSRWTEHRRWVGPDAFPDHLSPDPLARTSPPGEDTDCGSDRSHRHPRVVPGRCGVRRRPNRGRRVEGGVWGGETSVPSESLRVQRTKPGSRNRPHCPRVTGRGQVERSE